MHLSDKILHYVLQGETMLAQKTSFNLVLVIAWRVKYILPGCTGKWLGAPSLFEYDCECKRQDSGKVLSSLSLQAAHKIPVLCGFVLRLLEAASLSVSRRGRNSFFMRRALCRSQSMVRVTKSIVPVTVRSGARLLPKDAWDLCLASESSVSSSLASLVA